MKVIRLAVGPLSANCYIVYSREDCAVIDPGGGPEKIIGQLREFPGKLKYIINTHSHFDHIGANREIRKAAGGRLFIHEKERPYIDFEPDAWLKDGDKIEIGRESLEVVGAPGHTPGSICLLGQACIFTGDTLFQEGYGRTDLPGGSPEEMAKSLEKISALIKPGMTIYPGHGDMFKA